MIQDRPIDRKRVLVVTSTFPRWTDDTEPGFVFELSARLSEHFDICVLAPHTRGAKATETIGTIQIVRFRYFFEWGERLAYQGGILANLRHNRLLYLAVPLFLFFETISIIRLLRTEKFDAIHAHWLIPQGLSVALAKLLHSVPCAVVTTAHGSDLHRLKGRLFSAIQRFVIRQTSVLTTVSPPMKIHAESLGGPTGKTQVISMGVDTLNAFTPSPHSPRNPERLLFVGRLSREKGPEVVIRAMPLILQHFPNAVLEIVGQGPDSHQLRRLMENLHLAQSIVFLGAIPNEQLPEFYRHASFLVFPSTGEEGFGLVCAEALACECPVVAADRAACRELVIEHKTGLLFQSGDAEDLARKAIHLLASPTLRESLGKAGRELVSKKFEWCIIADRFRTLIDETILRGEGRETTHNA